MRRPLSESISIVPLLVRWAPELLMRPAEKSSIVPLLVRRAPELLMSTPTRLPETRPPSTKIVPPFLSVPEFVIVPPVLDIMPWIKLVPGPRLRLAPPVIIRVLPLASCKPLALPAVSSVTVLVPFKTQAFVEAVGVPLVQLPLRSQKLLPPFCHMVDGAPKLPH